MKSSDLLRRIRRLATRRGWTLEIVEGGSHSKIRLQGRSSVVPRHAKDMPMGTRRAILKQLGIAQADLEE